MKKIVALTLVASFLLASCSATTSDFKVQTRPGDAVDPNSLSTLKEAVRRIPLGTTVVVRTVSGEKIVGTLGAIREDGIVIQSNPESYKNFGPTTSKPVEVPYHSVWSVERPRGMSHGAKVAAALGLGVLAGIVIMAFAFAREGPAW